jgi:biotin-(acetyl-CoA carboxylase) ligase
MSRADAEDWYRIDMTVGRLYLLQTTGVADTYGELYSDPFGDVRLAYNQDAGPGRNFRIWYRPTSTGTYWLKVVQRVDDAVFSYALQWRQR